ncbi:transglycosylase SLT domain-containing protein [Wenzhouxiangella sp. XN24]|uniref:transglycosylase SLT domain-containing protein n=1 Tax=Wenzhouxiangella sp. XN24 TaxID=2713569 RepID=UPI0013EBF63C|nr:transglycosylase SLT domain-containing protein [Wenzhouxiangella sp. XN24]NGX16106.1 transglycosylase SLT domain-containing protein [Wenzhouxiangella sp. XN24]
MPLIALCTALLLSLATPATAAATLDSQRDAFRAGLAHAEAGRWDRVEPELAALQGYPLLPDLRAAFLRSRLGRVDDAEVRAFLAAHPELGFSDGLRRQWAHSLARRGAWGDYLEVYEQHYATRNDTTLDCHAFTARLRRGATAGLAEAALARWLSPVSQPEACDPAFEWLAAQRELTDERRRQRMTLALEVGEFRLARWLARPLGDAAVAEVDRWSRIHADPVTRLGAPDDWRDTPRERALLLYGFQRLASAEPELAARRWPAFRATFAFEDAERALVDRRIALVHAWRHLPGAADLLATLPADSHDADTRTWAVRLAIRAQDWQAVEAGLARLDAGTAAEPVWRYWQARMLEATGRAPAARPVYAALATERGYYSFMAADRLDADYNWQHADTAPDEAMLAALARRPDLVRARELFHVGLENHGRIEWQRAVARLAPPERAQAGILAKRWGWYSRAITAATGAGLVNDLDLRFPLPWRPLIEAQSARAGISSAWVYGVTRSESLFMPDASSGAGAIGLMQLLPATGRQTAPQAGVSFRGYQTLLDPETNVALGTTYLAEMLARFGNHRVLATAAYNAGPNRVDRWLPDDASLPADAWVDSMPYRETRGYVQRVLASEAVFQWRMSGQTVRITEAMQPVPPRAGSAAGVAP